MPRWMADGLEIEAAILWKFVLQDIAAKWRRTLRACDKGLHVGLRSRHI